MILKALWDGCWRPLRHSAGGTSLLAVAVSFPIVSLESSRERHRDIRVMFDDVDIGCGAKLGDVLAEELGITVASGSCILVVEAGMPQGPGADLAIAAEILRAAITRSGVAHEVALFDWAWRSLCLTWAQNSVLEAAQFAALADEVAAQAMDYSGPADRMELEDYLLQLEPDFRVRHLDPRLVEHLGGTISLEDWCETLRACYNAAVEFADLPQAYRRTE